MLFCLFLSYRINILDEDYQSVSTTVLSETQTDGHAMASILAVIQEIDVLLSVSNYGDEDDRDTLMKLRRFLK